MLSSLVHLHRTGRVTQPLPLKPRILVKKIGHFSKTQKNLENKEKSVSVNPFLRFTKNADIFTKILGFKGRGSSMTSKLPTMQKGINTVRTPGDF